MRITPVKNNYNNTFNARNINKNLINKNNNKKLLQSTESEYGIVKEMNAISRNCFATSGIMASTLALQLLDVIPTIATLIVTSASGIGLLAASLFALKSKDSNKKQEDNNNEKLSLPLNSVPNKYKLDLMLLDNNEVLESENSSLIKYAVLTGKLNDDLTKYFRFVTDKLDKVDKEIVVNYFTKMQLEEDENRQIPMHKYDIDQMEKVLRNLQDCPEAIAEIMMSKDINGEIPIHKFINDDFSKDNLENFSKIFSALDTRQQLNYRTLISVFNTKNKDGISANDWLEKHMEKSIKQYDFNPRSYTMLSLQQFNKNIYKNSEGHFQPIMSTAELKHRDYILNKINEQKEIDYHNIMSILDDSEVQKTKGLDLNYSDNYAADIINFLANSATNDERKDIILKLKELNKIDYDKIDSNETSALETIMNSEDNELLDLVKNNTFKYRVELDYTYENISNSDFKNKIKNLNYDFVELKDAIKTASYQKLINSINHIKSPLFDKNKQTENMKVPRQIFLDRDFVNLYNQCWEQFAPKPINFYNNL